MDERKERWPHPLLAEWLEQEGEGAMTRLVRASGRTWAAIDAIVWKGAVPRGDTALALAKATGIDCEKIIEGAMDARRAKEAAEAA